MTNPVFTLVAFASAEVTPANTQLNMEDSNDGRDSHGQPGE